MLQAKIFQLLGDPRSIPMQPPLPIGTVFQNRYRSIEILARGGFGRTYLARDQGRFQELCTIEELSVPQTNPQFQELFQEFQREVSILYQIQHPQIPQFRATFEQDGRLFLVRDYVEGKTYRQLMNERKAQGQKFSETEVLQLLQQLLPVLDRIHSKGIIHRDISPENIILRESDRLPVLIDFGLVKELANRFQFPHPTPPAAFVGKLGYAPSEQTQTGRVYPSSDLYSLAVTCIVLLTTQEPQVLFDEITLSWNWYRWIPPIHPGFTQVLNRMLSYKAGDRYQDAREAARTLQQALSNPASVTVAPPKPPDPDLQVQTIAVSNSQPSYQSKHTSKRSHRAIPSPLEPTPWDSPWVVALLGMGLALLAGVGSWALVSTILNSQSQVRTAVTPIAPIDRPSESITPTTISATPTPTSSPEAVVFSKRINLFIDEIISNSGNLKANATANYKFAGEQGQKLVAWLDEEGVLMTILGPDEQPVDDRAKRVTRWEGILPLTGNYAIVLRTVKGVSESEYKLNLRLSNVEPPSTPTPTETPTQTATPTPSPTQTISPTGEFDVEPLNLPEGTAEKQLSGKTSPKKSKRYLVNVQEGQVLSARLQTEGTTLDIRYPNGQLVENATGLGEWEGKVEQSGEYQIDVTATEEKDFTIDISVRE